MIQLIAGDCREKLASLPSRSVHMALTDPPYFLDGLDGGWRKGVSGPRGTGSVGGLPIGMKFDPAQGRALQAFMEPVAAALRRVMFPGAFALVFSSPRLAHRMAIAFEDAGFEIRDVYAWRFTKQAQFKAFSMNHFVHRRKGWTESRKALSIKKLDGRKTPQLRPQFESIICAQKPRRGTFVDNWLDYGTGLIDPRQSLDGKAPSTVMGVEKEAKVKGHLTVKPLRLFEHLIRLFTTEGQTVLDPFVGSGTACLAAHSAGRHSIGIDVNPEYIEMAERRLRESGWR